MPVLKFLTRLPLIKLSKQRHRRIRIHICKPGDVTDAAINRFLATVCVIGVQPLHDRQAVYAPFGYIDLENMYVRPNLSCAFQPDNYLEKARRWVEVWPEAQMEEGGRQAYLNYAISASGT